MSLVLCIDYMALNQKFVQTPNQFQGSSLKGNEWFFILDQETAYHQGYLKPLCQHYTAVILPWELHEWLRIPFVSSGPPGSFQQFMEETLVDYRDELCNHYLDDVLVLRRTFTKHIEGIGKVTRRLRETEIMLKPKKNNGIS